MQHTLFISDLHLQMDEPKITENFIRFIEEEAIKADALYILGDFFEAWIGDDDQTPFHTEISLILKNLARKQIPVYFLHGNRDFLLGPNFAEQCGMTLLSDPMLIELYNQRILITHGDLLCTLDIRHQKYRQFVLNPRMQNLFLKIPLWIRRKIAHSMRQRSQRYNQTLASHISDVMPDEVIRLMDTHQVPLMIHGHTHRPHIHELNVNGQLAYRIVLGAWHEGMSCLRFFADGSYELLQ